jgi:tetratricopeptide (TPR) repeat protein
MRQRLSQLFQVPADLDYVESFQALSKANLEIRRYGPTAERLLRKARLERDVGNHSSSLVAAQDALVLDPRNPEMHYQVGLAFLYLALARAGALPVGPSPGELPEETVLAFLEKAVAAFRLVVELNPKDEDARQDAQALEAAIAGHPGDAALAEALRSRKA